VTGGALRATAPIALGVAGFLLGAAGVRALVPLPAASGLRDKLEFLATHGADYDTVVLGTSDSQYGVRPEVLDAELVRLGHPQHSFNLAVEGLNAYELVALADELLARRPPRLMRVWLEVLPWQLPAGAERRDALVARDLWWRSLPRTLDVLSALRRSGAPPAVEREQAGFHLRRWAQRAVGLAQGPVLLADLVGVREEAPFLDAPSLAADAGWRALREEDAPDMAAAHRRFLARASTYREAVAGLDAANASDAHDFSLDLPALDALLARLSAAGCEVLLFVPPVDRSTAEAYRLSESGELPPVLGFNAPSRYPTLYLLDRRFDDVHLNERGATEFSTLLARAAAHGPLAHPAAATAAADEGAR